MTDAAAASPTLTVSVAGAQLPVRVHGSVEGPGDALLFVPAMGVPARYYDRLGAALAERGVALFVPDVRGQGDSRPAPGRSADYGYLRLATGDLPAVLEAMRRHAPDRRAFIGGHSLGGQLVMTFAAEAKDVAGIVLVAASNPYFRAQPPVTAAKVLLVTHLAMGVSRVYGYWPGDQLKFMGRQSRGVMRDWARLARTGRLQFDGSTHDAADDHAALSFPVLSVSIDGDHRAPPSAVDALVRRVPEKLRVRRHYETTERVDHVSWVRREPVGVADLVADWLATVR